ncbi:MAG: FKBP-type peptidyl-prolyl cis-trans isomerase [Bacteroidales bacterium]|nr:FKBP-type peptidyl-prolyl cis-trans isomerase [Bacteroidales bacterium]MBN2749870.1 FKBP-type peptidyl-prolyl cis-trans isomerase [Bacteroidales bacterium]
MKILRISLLILSTAALLSSCNQKGAIKSELKTDLDSASYALGINISDNFKKGNLENVNVHALAMAMQEAFEGKETKMSPEQAIEVLNKYFQKKEEEKASKNEEEGKKFLEENATKEGVIVDSTGLQYKVITEGTGANPRPEDVVKVHYKGTLINGEEFDSSYDGEPAQFMLNRVIKGWQIGLQKMKVGGKAMLYIPGDLAYGKNPRPGGAIGPNQLLIFEVELLDIVKE